MKKTSIYRKTSFYWTEFRVPLISYPSTQRQICCIKLQLDFKKTLEGQQYLLFTFSQNKPQDLGGPSNFDDDTEIHPSIALQLLFNKKKNSMQEIRCTNKNRSKEHFLERIFESHIREKLTKGNWLRFKKGMFPKGVKLK